MGTFVIYKYKDIYVYKDKELSKIWNLIWNI